MQLYKERIEMQNTYQWKVIPSGEPTVIKSCSKCGNHAVFESSGNFRVNANQNHIDVWLIYQCRKCKSTWNMEILSRVPNKSIKKELYMKLLKNDPELARKYAYDIIVHNRNKVNMNYDEVLCDIISTPAFAMGGNNQIEICCDYPLDLRLDKLLSQKLGLSRERIKKLFQTGDIVSNNGQNLNKVRLNYGLSISLRL